MEREFMKRPIIIVAICYIIGIISVYEEKIFIGLTLMMMMFIYLYKKYNPKKIFFIFFVLFYFFGAVRMAESIEINNKKNMDVITEKVEVEGLLYYKSETTKGSSKLQLKNITINGLKKKGKLVAYSKKANIQIGDKIKLYGSIENPKEPTNFGGYDEYIYYKSRKIDYKMFVDDIDVIKESKSILPIIRNKFRNNIDDTFYLGKGDIVKAMVLGDDSFLSDNTKELYRNSGIYHILIISGLHIGIIFQSLNFVFSKFKMLKNKTFIIIIVIIFYSYLTGNSLSTVRAVLMMSIFSLATYLKKYGDSLSGLFLTIIILLIYEPIMIFDVGFLYSFSAVGGILTLNEPIYTLMFYINLKLNNIFKLLEHKIIYEKLAFLISIQISTLPVSLYFFYNYYTYGIIANLMIMPFTYIVVVLSFVSMVLGGILPIIKFTLMPTVFLILEFFELVSETVSNLPYFKILIGRPNIIFIILYFYMIFVVINFKKPNIVKNLIGTFVIIVAVSFNNKMEVVFLDVGQGDSIVINYKGKVIVIDGGINDRVLKNYLDYKGVSKVDAVIGTHTDKDHVGGLIDLIDKKNIIRFMLPNIDYDEDDKNYIRLREKLTYKGIDIDYLQSGMQITIDDCIISVLNPTRKIYGNKNNGSVVLQVNYKDVSFLLTGDIGSEEKELIDLYNLRSNILKVGHHGSKTSSSDIFLKAVNPSVGIVSSKKNNMYGHPSKEVVENLNINNIEMLQTSELGDIKFVTDGKRMFLKTVR